MLKKEAKLSLKKLSSKTPVPEEVKSLERYELEKQTKLLINLPEE